MTSDPSVSINGLSPLRWLRLGWRDLLHHPLPGLMHGTAVALFGLLLILVAQDQFWWLVGAFSGFLIVAPIVATGLYAVSRRVEQGQPVGLNDVLAIWRSGDRRLMGFGALLAAAGTGWVLTSAGLITLWAPGPVYNPKDFFELVVWVPSPGLFEVWVFLGALLAAPIFASSVLTLPLLVDSSLPLWQAVGQSWRAVGTYPIVMALWALVIACLVLLGLLTMMLGLVVIVPWLGHASWHVYADLKRAGAVSLLPG